MRPNVVFPFLSRMLLCLPAALVALATIAAGAAVDDARDAADAYATTIPSERRKKLGQFFTGVKLGKLLAHLALDQRTRSALDPMVGSGDL